MKKVAAFTLAYFVITMAWAYAWHMFWFHDLYVSWGAFTRDEPIMLLGVSAIIVQGIVIGELYPHFQLKAHPLVSGIAFSLLAGLLVYTAMGFATAAKFDIEPVGQFLLYHSAFQFVQFTLTGAALGLIYSREEPEKKLANAI